MVELTYFKNNTKRDNIILRNILYCYVIIILQNGFISRNLIFMFVEV